MTDEMTALARRAVACKAWRLLPGMVDEFGGRIVATRERVLWDEVRRRYIAGPADGIAYAPPVDSEHDDPVHSPASVFGLPDLTDPATLGCLLALVRNVWGAWACAVMWQGGWRMMDTRRPNGTTVALSVWDQPTEAHALVAALEAAP